MPLVSSGLGGIRRSNMYRYTVVCVFVSPAPVRQVVLGKLYFLMFVVPLVSSGLGGSRRSNGFLIYIYIYIYIYNMCKVVCILLYPTAGR